MAKTFKEFAEKVNLIPRGHKMVKIISQKGSEVMVTTNDNKFHVIHDAEVMASKDSKNDAMKAAKDLITMLNK